MSCVRLGDETTWATRQVLSFSLRFHPLKSHGIDL